MRLVSLKTKFKQYYQAAPEVVVCSPGRAEILGCHTDYNLGYALGAAISKNTLVLLKKRADDRIICRTTFSDFKDEALEFSLNDIKRSGAQKWGNYLKAVVRELSRAGKKITGAEILLDTNFPSSGGLSSSAALELGVAFGLLTLSGEAIDRLKLAQLCRTAENSDLVQSPCGFLDQGTIAFAQKDKLVFLDFALPVKVKMIPAVFGEASFVVAVDRQVKRMLGESGYPARRKSCEAACASLKINSLRELSVKEFERKKGLLIPLTRRRAEHIVYENQRVLDAVKALEGKDMVQFGRLLTESGRSSLELYELAEKTPELKFLVEKGRELPGVLGLRNMGGGFSAVVLALVKNPALPAFQKKLSAFYRQQFGRELEYIKFKPSGGTQVL